MRGMDHAKNDEKTSVLFPFVALLAVVAALSFALAYVAPELSVPIVFARVFGELWLMTILLATCRVAPRVKPESLAYALIPAAILGGLLWSEIGTESPSLFVVITVSVLSLGCLVGGYIGALLEHPSMLFVVAYVAALGDCFSVFHPHGLTANIMKDPQALAVLTLSVPVLGTKHIVPLVGIGDVAFAAVFFVGTRVTGLSERRTLLALAGALIAVVLSVEVLHLTLPAVPFMSVGIVAMHRETRSLPRAQATRILLNLLVVTVVLAGLWLVGRPMALG